MTYSYNISVSIFQIQVLLNFFKILGMNILSKVGPTKSITTRTTSVTSATTAATTSITTNKRPYKSLAKTCLFLVTAVAETVDKFHPHIFYKKLTKGSGVENKCKNMECSKCPPPPPKRLLRC